jgi:hypothetical protein
LLDQREDVEGRTKGLITGEHVHGGHCRQALTFVRSVKSCFGVRALPAIAIVLSRSADAR